MTAALVRLVRRLIPRQLLDALEELYEPAADDGLRRPVAGGGAEPEQRYGCRYCEVPLFTWTAGEHDDHQRTVHPLTRRVLTVRDARRSDDPTGEGDTK